MSEISVKTASTEMLLELLKMLNEHNKGIDDPRDFFVIGERQIRAELKERGIMS